MTFHVGQKVAAVRDETWSFAVDGSGVEHIARGSIFTVTGVEMWNGESWLYFAESPRVQAYAAFGDDGTPNFRPIVERKTDISIFTRMLTPETADA